MERAGIAELTERRLDIGGVKVSVAYDRMEVWVRRDPDTLEAVDIMIYYGDAFAAEELEELNRQAELHPAGPKEFWRAQMVGIYTYGYDKHPMTAAEFEEYWADDLLSTGLPTATAAHRKPAVFEALLRAWRSWADR
jgi:hypothetical protein